MIVVLNELMERKSDTTTGEVLLVDLVLSVNNSEKSGEKRRNNSITFVLLGTPRILKSFRDVS